jgi:hypothetical protein
MKTIISVSKKAKNPRSVFLSALMKNLGGDTGDAIANAFVGTDPDKFKDAMTSLTDKVVKAMPNSK